MKHRNLILGSLLFIFIFAVSAFVLSGRNSVKVTKPVAASTADAVAPPPLSPAVEPPLSEVVRESKDNRRLDALIDQSVARQTPALHEGEWINSEPTTLANLRGRVVLVDFWTYGCYNCINTLPTLKRLDKTYREQGLTVLGVETPEFPSEKILANVQKAVEKREIKYPVVMDAGGDTWRAFDINAWPTVVILDKQGRIRYSHVGEGAYAEQEAVIKILLAESTDKADKAANPGNEE